MLLSLSLLALAAGLVGASPAPLPEPAPDKTLSARAGTISNPVIYEDYPDLDVFRVGSVYYYSSSTFAYSPGAPLLKSYDLINWAPVTHSVPYLNFGSQYNLTGNSRAYESGIWASTVRYRNSTDTWYWYGCVGFSVTYIWTAKGTGAGANGGDVPDDKWNWQPAGTINTCFYDCGLLIDSNDDMYVAYGSSPKMMVSKLAKDGLSIASTAQVYTASTGLEGSRMYQYNGKYYIFNDIPANAETVIMSSSPMSGYSQKTLFSNVHGPISNAGYAHQGGMVDTPDGKYYFFAFMDSYPAGRIPVAAPLTFGSDGWPSVSLSGNTWPSTVAAPNAQTSKTVPSLLGTDNFTGSALSAEWEWNHNPDTTKFKLLGGGGLQLSTATVTTDIFQARNTLTHRIMGPKSTGTFYLDISGMAKGDRAGAAIFRDNMAYIGVVKSSSGSAQLVMVNDLVISGSGWPTTGHGSTAATGPTLPAGQTGVWLRVTADVTPAFSGTSAVRQVTFQYSTDGNTFTTLGPSFGLSNSYTYFTGYRYGVFNFATSALGGSVVVKSFTMEKV